MQYMISRNVIREAIQEPQSSGSQARGDQGVPRLEEVFVGIIFQGQRSHKFPAPR